MTPGPASATRSPGTADRERRVLFWVGACTAAVAVVCLGACIGYPYTGGSGFVPRDYWWMYPASLAALLAVALLMSLPRRETRWPC